MKSKPEIQRRINVLKTKPVTPEDQTIIWALEWVLDEPSSKEGSRRV